ncbi:pyridoxal-phosphate dependent enzyme [Neolewinella aurantiaca]|uniref:Pyridoxal-phosphate dependent enzyme n=1 Tax=Neolewinella aurantiaca TaxID=2602767 RepID=A0A5C7FLN6_9BACT|nr:pyridoxal-phosphate dependent enzyme [Neolewinella aurantiaca]TXF90931.1 pyridoxal-phosphate dependent enzyme [Neolewinella aurantiaca]
MTSPLQRILHPAADAAGIELWCKRDDLYSPAPGTALQGNKVRKLEPILGAARGAPVRPVLFSFGGAFSNHLSALATAGRIYGLRVVIYVRGEEADNPVLDRARADGAELILISRVEYRMKKDHTWLMARRAEIAERFATDKRWVWPVPEGGSGAGAAESVGQLYDEVVAALGAAPSHLCLSAGTGCSAAGVIAAAHPATHVEVYPALKGNWMASEIIGFLPDIAGKNWSCIPDYHFGGYARFPKEWIVEHGPSSPPGTCGLATIADIGEPGLPPLEPVYNAKLFYGVMDRIRKGIYPQGSTVVVVHSGGIY